MSHTPPHAIGHGPLMAIVRSTSAAAAVERALSLAARGVRQLEISLVTPGALDAIEAVRSALTDDVSIGAGTVLTVAEARTCVAHGAEFLVSPAFVDDVSTAAAALGVGYYPGAATPTEILTAWRRGASAVKVFPAGPLGPDFFRAVREPLPDIPLLAVGGVTAESAPRFIAAGAVGVGMGGALANIDVPALLESLTRTARPA